MSAVQPQMIAFSKADMNVGEVPSAVIGDELAGLIGETES
jgi:hypothetical protein